MAVTLVGSVLSSADASTGWSGVTNVDTDSEVQGTGCLGTKVSNATTNTTFASTQDLSAGGSNPDYHIVMWLNCLTPTLNTQTNGGLRITVTDTTNTKEYYVGGSDNRKAGWGAYVVSPRIASDVNGTPSSANITSIGGTVSTNATIMGNFNNGLWDQLTIGEGLRWTGTSGAFSDFITADEGTKNNSYGWLRTVANGSIILPQCRFYVGDGSTTTTFSDSAVLMVFEPATGVATNSTVDSDFFGIISTAAASITLSGNSFISASSADSQWALDVQTSTSASSFTNSTFDNARAIDLASNTTFTNMTVTNSGSITTNGATITDCTISDQTGPVIVSDLDEISNCTFVHSSDTPGHAVDLGTISTNTSMDWDSTLSSNTSGDWIGSPGNGVDANSTDAAIDVSVNSGITLTINVTGGSVPTVNNDGTGTVNVVSSVSVSVDTIETDGTDEDGVKVLVLPSDGTNYKYQAAITSITRSTTTATVTTTATHGLTTNDYVMISGVTNEGQFNGVHLITVTGASTFTFTVADTGATSASGTLIFTYVLLYGTTTSGTVSASVPYSSSQAVTGRARKSSGSPYFKTSAIAGTLTASGFSTTVTMIRDE